MELKRAAGVLLHPTSLPGPYGIGDLGLAARRFLDFLTEAGQSLWQVLPLGPTGYADSPYAPFSAFAGNPLLISLEALAAEGDLDPRRLEPPPDFPSERVDYAAVLRWKPPLLEEAARNFLRRRGKRREAFEAFRRQEAHWLAEYALFMSIKEHFDRRAQGEGADGSLWHSYWPEELALREPAALERWKTERAEELAILETIQFFFDEQWQALRRYARERGIAIIGDIPIFVAPDSADVWSNRELFHLDVRGRPTVVAGVPPDYFSAGGQLWGNPLFDWTAMAARGYRWWIERVRSGLKRLDYLRIDHFRGFQAYWEVPAGSPTAAYGRWVPGPDAALFETLRAELGELPILAEDLGVITPEVERLRDRYGFPGMKILQFAFDTREAGAEGAANKFLPHNHPRNAVVYTGTHDNDTTLGWYRRRTPEERAQVLRYLALGEDDREPPPGSVVWGFIRLALASVASFAILPLQDLLGLGSEARMNTPSTLSGNWAFRCRQEQLTAELAARLAALTRLYGRFPPKKV
jgi:4-alpha-glucanotransferase